MLSTLRTTELIGHITSHHITHAHMHTCTHTHTRASMTLSAYSPPNTLIFLRKSTYFGLHTEVNLKDQFCDFAKTLKVLHGRSCIFQKKYAFPSSVVTSMCVPPIENAHFFLKSSDLQSKTPTFLSRSCQIKSGNCILLRKSIHFALHTTNN